MQGNLCLAKARRMGINFVDILLHVVNVVILYFFLRFLLYKPVNKFLKGRQERIQARIDDIEQKQKLAEKSKAEYDDMLKKAHAQAAEIIKRSNDLAKQHSKEIMDKADVNAKELMVKAAQDIETEKTRAREKMKQEITDMAVKIAEKVLEREVSVTDNQKIIDDFFTKVG